MGACNVHNEENGYDRQGPVVIGTKGHQRDCNGDSPERTELARIWQQLAIPQEKNLVQVCKAGRFLGKIHFL